MLGYNFYSTTFLPFLVTLWLYYYTLFCLLQSDYMQIRICLVLFTSIMMLQEVLRWIRSIVAEFGTPNISTEQLADYINKTLSKGQVMS